MDYCTVNSALAVWTNQTIEAAYCAASDSPYCFGICPNTDLAGIGVRVAFYVQAAMNAAMIVMCPEDAAAGAWAATVLTGALVIPAIIQKAQQNLTLHHAVIVLNFATMSTVASLASAPMVPIWRGAQKHGRGRAAEKAFEAEEHHKTQGRKVLSFAVLTQIILQWVWAVLLFVDPYYAQVPCSGKTVIVFVFGAYTADEINDRHFALWAVWLLICICMSLVWGASLVLTCRSPVHNEPWVDRIRIQSGTAPGRRAILLWRKLLLRLPAPDPPHDEHYIVRWGIRFSIVFATLVVIMYMVLTETQIRVNQVLSGENEFWTFSQTAAVLLALAPIWPIWVSALKPLHQELPQHTRQATIYPPPAPSFTPSPPIQYKPFQLTAAPGHKLSTYNLHLANNVMSPASSSTQRMLPDTGRDVFLSESPENHNTTSPSTSGSGSEDKLGEADAWKSLSGMAGVMSESINSREAVLLQDEPEPLPDPDPPRQSESIQLQTLPLSGSRPRQRPRRSTSVHLSP